MRVMEIRTRGKENGMRLLSAEDQGERELYDEPGESWGSRMQYMREQRTQAPRLSSVGDAGVPWEDVLMGWWVGKTVYVCRR